MAQDDSKQPQSGQRIAKWIAQSGLGSRRQAEEMIQQGRVTVDGILLTTAACVLDDPSRIQLDGTPLPSGSTPRMWVFYKPAGVLTTRVDTHGRPTIMDYMPSHLPRVISVGRLDMMSEGLLLMTNHGPWARFLEHPQNAVPRTYHVRIFGRCQKNAFQGIEEGMTVDGVHYAPGEVKVLSTSGANTWLEMTLYEGKNREIRNMMMALGYKVNRLIRVAYGSITLGDMAPGDIYPIHHDDLKDLLPHDIEF